MNLLIWQWTIGLQVGSGLLITLFLYSIARKNKRPEVHYWFRAWLANLAAVSIAMIHWTVLPESIHYLVISSFLFPFFKTLFVLLLLVGLARFLNYQNKWMLSKPLLAFASCCGFIGTFIADDTILMGMFCNAVIVSVLGFSIYLITREIREGISWILVGFIFRGALGLLEGYYYFLSTQPGTQGMDIINMFLAAHSAFDTAAEWCIAIGCVLAIMSKDKWELQLSNEKLLQTQSQLQELVDKDPLTGLTNRRCLRDILEHSKENGATVLFFDLNNFKLINDRYGHKKGDEALVLFAESLRHCFRANDHIIRYAGDEFVVVTEALDKNVIDQRIEATQQYLESKSRLAGRRLTFSVGVTELNRASNVEQAVHLADEAMYRDKQIKKDNNIMVFTRKKHTTPSPV